MESPRYKRYPKDFASTVMTVACADALLFHDQAKSSYAWEAATFGAVLRDGFSGPKTHGTLARNQSGQVVFSQPRLEELSRTRLGVLQSAKSILWEMLRRPRVLSTEEMRALDPIVDLVVNEHLWLLGGVRRARVDEELLQRLAACGTLDAVAAMWSLLLEAEASGKAETAFLCARYLPVTVALLGVLPVGQRVAFLILARLRQQCLDRISWQGRRLALVDFDLMGLQASASRLPPLELMRDRFMRSRHVAKWPVHPSAALSKKLFVPEERMQWVINALPRTRGTRGPRPHHVWKRDWGPLEHPESPCRPKARPHFHRAALDRIRGALGPYA